jgi:hypothetical protein
MSIPLPGTYKLRNVNHSDQIFYLSGGAVAAGTNVVGRKKDKTKNMLVRVYSLTQSLRLTISVVDLASS